jgi:hypothetical protein
MKTTTDFYDTEVQHSCSAAAAPAAHMLVQLLTTLHPLHLHHVVENCTRFLSFL